MEIVSVDDHEQPARTAPPGRNRAIARCPSLAILMGSTRTLAAGPVGSTALVPTGVVALVREHSRPRAMPNVRPPVTGRSAPTPHRPGPAPHPARATRARRAGRVIGTATVLFALGGCSWVSGMFGTNDGPPTEEISVFDIAIGQCFAAQQGEPEVEQSSLDAVPCDVPHRQEAYSIVQYVPPEGVHG